MSLTFCLPVLAQMDQAEWLSVKDAPIVTGQAAKVNRAADGASWFVTTIENEKKVKSTKWTTTALGIYELYLNGQPVGKEILKPGFTHYAKTRRSFTYDVTDLFQKGKGAGNQLAAQVTPGWWADKIITPGDYNGMLGEKCAFRCALELTFTDGSRQYFVTNRKDWLAGIAADPANPGFKHIIMKPAPDKRLGFVKAEYQSSAGLIKSSWRYEGDQWIWDFTIPEGSTATVMLPGETEGKEYNSGSHHIGL